MLSRLAIGHWLTLHGFATLVGVLIYVVTSRAMAQRRAPAAAIAWVLFILLIPYLALPAFLILGARKRARRSVAGLRVASRAHCSGGWTIQTTAALGQPPSATYHDLNVHADGHAALTALLDAIDSAQHSLDVCTFILRKDSVGSTVVAHLCERARSGVRVRVLLDGLGYLMSPSPDMRQIVEAGGEWALFVPPLRAVFSGHVNLREHRKMLIADAGHESARLWCGGRNLGEEYFAGGKGVAPWRDLTFDLRGAVVAQSAALFEQDWGFANGRQALASAAAVPASGVAERGAQLLASGPDQPDDTLHALLLTAAYQARDRIILVTPYFLPEAALLQALCLAARRGVSIDLLMPAKSNHRLSDMARNRSLRALSQAGARVRLTAGMLHAKLVVIDDSLSLSGSANIDTRSLFLNYEIMMAFHEPKDVQHFAAWFDNEALASYPYVAVPPGAIRDLAEGLLLWIAFEL
jgi:cardiolipin synthase